MAKKPMTSVLAGFLCITVGLVSGAAAVAVVGVRQVSANQADEHAGNAAFEAEVLGHIRLGEADQAAAMLEQDLDANVAWVRDQGTPPIAPGGAGPLTPKRASLLSRAKTYRLSYPSTQPQGRGSDVFLAQVPDFHGGPTCHGAVCRIAKSAATAGAATDR
jgi:hypothetical protein